MELIRKPIHYTQTGKNIFDQFYLDEDYNVPEQKEDIQRIICGSAVLSAEDIRPVENYIRVAGKIHFRVLYMADQGEPHPAVLEGKIPFEEMVYAESDGNETFFLCNSRTEFTPSQVHPRKLSLKITAEIEIGREWIRDEELTEDIDSDIQICRKTKKMNLLSLPYRKEIHTGSKKRSRCRGRKKASGRCCLRMSASGSLISGWARMKCCCAGSFSSSACIYRPAETRSGWTRQSPLRGGSSATV